MRLKPITWLLISLCLFIAAGLFWHWGEQQKAAYRAAKGTNAAVTGTISSQAPSVAGTNAPAASLSVPSAANGYRLSNTTNTIGELERNDHAILLRNATIDTTKPIDFEFPDGLKSTEAPGSYVVQSRQALDAAFYSLLSASGAEFVSYIPNNAALVNASESTAARLRGSPLIQSVVPYEPYYKLDLGLVAAMAENKPLGTNILVSGSQKNREAMLKKFADLGLTILKEDRNPFGVDFTVGEGDVPIRQKTLEDLASTPVIQEIEPSYTRAVMNDLTRPMLGVANDTVATSSYLGLTGSNIWINIDDSGVEASHPDLTGRVFAGTNAPAYLLFDTNYSSASMGHGTHVAGIIAGDGTKSDTVTNAAGSIMPAVNGQFRGKAPKAKLFVQPLSGPAPFNSDFYLQETAARTNSLVSSNKTLISNDSWGYAGLRGYGMPAASFDAATRDAIPGMPGSQSVLYVFSAGNSGGGADSGLGGQADSILAPASGKNVIAVGALECPRNITNEVVKPDGAKNVTNTPWAGMTQSSTLVAPYSSRGNTGIGLEGQFGRFKPDVVAPGTFIVSTKSSTYLDPTNSYTQDVNYIADQTVARKKTNYYQVFVPLDGIQLAIFVLPNSSSIRPFPDFPIVADQNWPPSTPRGVNGAQFDVTTGTWNFGVVSPSANHSLSYDVVSIILRTNEMGNYFQVLSNLNASLGTAPTFYRYETGTSMAAPAVSGMLGLMQEFLVGKGVQPSPALLKAMLINGALTSDSVYDFQVNRNSANQEGWGLPDIRRSIPTNMVTTGSGPVQFFDQNPTNTLATGESHTRVVHIDPAARTSPLRITLVWTDPPGNPAASIKLVNDLDLIVTNLDNPSEVYVGNNFAGGEVYTTKSASTNAPPSDVINNVENVFMNAFRQPLGGNYSVTVRAARVNVNAVTAKTNGIVQDYALVISSLSSTSAAPFTVDANLTSATNALAQVDVLTNGYSALYQRVGANSPFLISTNGSLSQWHFYVFTNTVIGTNINATNVLFVTFLPPNLSIPRNTDADIDLYVSRNSGLLNLDPAVINSPDTHRSLRRGGSEFVYFNDSKPGDVFYVGVKSEDQQGAEYGLVGVATDQPLGTRNPDGSLDAKGVGLPLDIPDAVFAKPGKVIVVGAIVDDGGPMTIRKVTVTNGIMHQLIGDLTVDLKHAQTSVRLKNQSSYGSNPYQETVYDDSHDGTHPNSVKSDGPGSLQDFVGQSAVGEWVLTVNDNLMVHTGSVQLLDIHIDPKKDQNGFDATIQPNTWYYDYVDIPTDGTNLSISVSSTGGGSAGVYLCQPDYPTFDMWDGSTNISFPGGGSLNWGLTNSIPPAHFIDSPPLSDGRWYYGIYNPSGSPINVHVVIRIDRRIVPDLSVDYTSTNTWQVITNDMVTTNAIFIPWDERVFSTEVGIRIADPRAADLALSLVSPLGTRVLLFENRGRTNTEGLGLTVTNASGTTNYVYAVFTENTNYTTTPIKFALPPYGSTNNIVINGVQLFTSNFDTDPAADYTNGQSFDGWTVVSSNAWATNLIYTNTLVSVVGDASVANSGSNFLALGAGHLMRTNATVAGRPYRLSYAFRGPGIVDWWSGNQNTKDLIGGNNGTFVGTNSYAPGKVTAPGKENWAFEFDGSNQVVTVPDAPSLDQKVFTLEAWVMPTRFSANDIVTLIQKGNSSPVDSRQFELRLIHNTARDQWYFTPVMYSPSRSQYSVMGAISIQLNTWCHVAVTYDGSVERLYVNGVLDGSTPATGPMSLNSDPLWIGGQASGPWGFPGRIDEVSFYNRSLSPAEIRGIYNAGSAGKYSANSPMPSSQVVVDGIPSVIVGNNDAWQTNTLVFTATTNSTVIELDGNPLGMLFDSFKLEELPSTNYSNYYLPEESLDIFKGELAKGYWTLQAWDTRTGQATNADLISWDLRFTFSSTNVNLIVLTNRVPFTGTIAAGSNVFFGFDVPADASFTTNYLTNFTTTPGLDLLFNQTQLPTGTLPGDVALLNNVTANGMRILAKNTSFPLIQPGKRYFLGLYNSGATAQSYGIQIDADLDPNFTATPLTNGVVLTTNVTTTSAIQYFYYDVSPSAVEVEFKVLEPTSDVDLYVQRGLPPPGPKNFDYFSALGGTNTEAVLVYTNSLPVPLTAQRWYLAVTSTNQPVSYSVKVTESTNIVEMTNSVPYTNTVPGAGASAKLMKFLTPLRAMASGSTAAASIDYIEVPVPEGVSYATNTLINITTNGTPLSLVFNQMASPEFGDYALLTNVLSGTNTLTLNGVPPLQPGVKYFLGVVNTNSEPQNYVFIVNFGLAEPVVSLTNTIAYSTTIPLTNSFQYYSFDVPANTGWVAFEILKPTANVDLAVNRTLPLPDFANSDYVSTNSLTNNEAIVVMTNLTVGRWYLAVTNTSGGANSYSIKATAWSNTNGLVVLTNHIAYTNTVPTNTIKYFAVDVPSNVIKVNNTLFSTNGLNTNGLTLLFNQTNMPLGTLSWDYTLLTNVTTTSSFLLSTNTPVTNTVPVLQPGQRYYLGVVNTNSTNADFQVQVDFEYTSIPLTNAVSYTNTMGANLIPQYYSFTVSSNAQRVTFEVLNPSGDVDLVAKLAKFPDYMNFSYASTNSGNTNEFILILTNSSPVALTGLTNGTWYLGVYNTKGIANLTYSIRACEWDSSTNMVVVTNGLSFTNVVGSNSYAYFAVDVPLDATGAINSLASSNGVDLLYSRLGLPTGFLPGDYLLLTNVVSANSAVIKTNGTVPLLEPGQRYFLGVHNTNAAPAQFSLNVEFSYLVTPLTNGILFTNRITSTNSVQFYSYDVVTNNDTLLWFEILKATGPLKLEAVRTNSYYANTNLDSYQAIVVTNLADLAPGHWLLAVHSLTTNAVTYGIRAVEMQSPTILSLTNGVSLGDKVKARDRRYYSFDVSTNATLVTFEVLHPDDYVDMVVRHSMPLPDYLNADYTTLNQFPDDQEILLTTNSTPVPLSPGRWYIGVYSAPGGFAANYEVRAIEYTNPVSVIKLTNGVSYKNTIATPGFALGANQQIVFYSFSITNSAPAVVFTAANMENPVGLFARKGQYPTVSTYDFASFNPDLLQQVLLIQTNATLSSLNGTWYLAARNQNGVDVKFDIAGTLLTTNGLNARPTIQSLNTTNGLQFSWNSIPGIEYEIDVSTNLPVFNPLTNFMAGSTNEFFIGRNPTNGIPYQFYRIIELLP